jgi:hypothetical protein
MQFFFILTRILCVSCENAVSTAVMILTTEAVVVDTPGEKGCCSHNVGAEVSQFVRFFVRI